MSHAPRIVTVLGASLSVATLVALVVACGSEGGDDSGSSGASSGSFDTNTKLDGGDQYAYDPPAPWCGPGGSAPPPPPGGTLECPDDKNKPGCWCDNVGEKAACWTGLRKHRGLGVCKDGVTECKRITETTRGWGPCEGEVLPQAGATRGAPACGCFSLGQWKLNNLSPCFHTFCSIDPGAGNPCPAANITGIYARSTLNSTGKCEPLAQTASPPLPVPGEIWSTDTLKVDCAGKFKLCYELKAGSYDNPQPADCSLTKVCVEADYPTANVEQPFPDLAGWSSPDAACAKKWTETGGYGEMSVIGESVRCDKIDDGAGSSFVFNRVKYCPRKCENGANPTDPECQGCLQGGSGEFK